MPGTNGKKLRGNPNWKKGVSGNPKGAPKKELSLAQVVRESANKKDPATRKTRLYALIDRAWELALGGDITWAKFIADRGWGRPMQPIEETSDRTIRFEFEDNDTVPEASVVAMARDEVARLISGSQGNHGGNGAPGREDGHETPGRR